MLSSWPTGRHMPSGAFRSGELNGFEAAALPYEACLLVDRLATVQDETRPRTLMGP